MAYPEKPTGDNIISETTVFASNNANKQVMTSSEILNGYNNDGETVLPLTSCPDANKFNDFWYKVHNTMVWIIQYIEELYNDKFSKTGGTITGNVIMGQNAKISGVATPTQASDAVPKSYVDSALAGAMWVGEIKAMAYPNIPSLPSGVEIVPCDGRAISRTTYAILFSLIGTQFGIGDGSTTFNIPDYRGLFLRGWDGGSNRDPNRAYGSIQENGAPIHNHPISLTSSVENTNHTHTAGTLSHNHALTLGMRFGADSLWAQDPKWDGGDINYGSATAVTSGAQGWTGTTSGVSANHTHTISGNTGNPSNSIYKSITEVRPVNSTCYYLIRIK